MEKDGIKTTKLTSKLDDDLLDDLLSDDDDDDDDDEGKGMKVNHQEQLDDDLLDDLLSDDDDENKDAGRDINAQSSHQDEPIKPSQDQSNSSLLSPSNDNQTKQPSINTVFTSQQLSSLADYRKDNTNYHYSSFFSFILLLVNSQNRKAKHASQMSDMLFLQYYIHSNQPQTHEAVITEIRRNGFIVHIPYFDMRLPFPLLTSTMQTAEWVKDTFHVNFLTIELPPEEEKLNTAARKKGVNGTYTFMKVYNQETNELLLNLSLYQKIRVQLTVQISTVAHRTSIHGNLVLDESTEVSGKVGNTEKVVKDCTLLMANDKKRDYFVFEGEDEISLENTRQALLKQIEAFKSILMISTYIYIYIYLHVDENHPSPKVVRSDSHTRLQFGGFVSSRLTIQKTWREQFGDFDSDEVMGIRKISEVERDKARCKLLMEQNEYVMNRYEEIGI